MTKVYYTVGKANTTEKVVCNSYPLAEELVARNPGWEITTHYSPIESEKAKPVSPMAKAMLEQFGFVSEKLKDRIVTI